MTDATTATPADAPASVAPLLILAPFAALAGIMAATTQYVPVARTSDGGTVALPARVHVAGGARYVLEGADAQGLRVLVREADGCRFVTVPGRRAVAIDDGCAAADAPAPKGS